ncbi:MAG: histidine kinase dimerization/phospho-acceptor domain-containing protein [Candidatus Zixiibacteriota bacterium]
MANREQERYNILRTLASAAAHDTRLEQNGQAAMEQTARLVGLSAMALHLWDPQGKPTLQLTYAESEDKARRLNQLERELFENLRRSRQLVSAYMSFAGDPPSHTFTLPLGIGDHVFGAAIGFQEGKRTVLEEDDFLDAVTCTLALHAVAGGLTSTLPKELVERERMAAINETAVTVNHEINNPLTAILGNVQLLLMHRKDLDAEVRNKLSVIEESASKIKDVTQKLLRLTSSRTAEYVPGTGMLDLSDPDDKKRRSK